MNRHRFGILILALSLAACGRPPAHENVERTSVADQGAIKVEPGTWKAEPFDVERRRPVQLELELDKGPSVDVYVVRDTDLPAWEAALTTKKRSLTLDSESELSSEHLTGSHMSEWEVIDQGKYMLLVDASGFGTIAPPAEGGETSVINYRISVK